MTSLNERNAEEIEWENIKELLVEGFIKRKEKTEKHSFDDALFVKRGAIFNRGRGQARGGRGNNSRRGSYGAVVNRSHRVQFKSNSIMMIREMQRGPNASSAINLVTL